MFLLRCIFFEGGFYLTEHWKGWLRPRDGPQGGPHSRLQLFPVCYGTFGDCRGDFYLHLWVSVPNVQVSIWVGSDTLILSVLSSLGLGLPVSTRVCVSPPPMTQRDEGGWRPLSAFPLPLTASVLGLSKGAVNLRVKLLSQHTWQSCSFRWNLVKIKHLSIPEAGALISQLLTFLTCKAEDNNFIYETGWDVWPKGPKPRRVNFY